MSTIGQPRVAFFFLTRASEPVILSAAGAKDLLSHRCEGPARSLNEAPDRRSSGPRRPSRRREPQRESVTYQLITNCYLSSELFITPNASGAQPGACQCVPSGVRLSH